MPSTSVGSSSISGSGKSRTTSDRSGTRVAAPPEVEACVVFRNIPRNCSFDAAERRALRKYASRLNVDIAAGRGFDCLVTNDEALRAMNRQFLGHDYATDVLSFPSERGLGAVGEMAISIDRAAAQAGEYGHSTLAEMEILMLHGVLHLVGYDHERDGGNMARLEQRWRVAHGLPAGLIGRQRKGMRRSSLAPGTRAPRRLGQ